MFDLILIAVVEKDALEVLLILLGEV